MANGKYALGICDRSGQIYKLRDLVFEITNGRRNGLRVGRDMVDPDYKQILKIIWKMTEQSFPHP